MKGILVLEDGTVFQADAIGRPGTSFGEIVFNTAMSGYQEVLTDPSSSGQIVVKAEKVPGAPWPRLSLYQIVDAPPTILQTLFGDYAAAPTYTPNLMSAKVIATNTAFESTTASPALYEFVPT